MNIDPETLRGPFREGYIRAAEKDRLERQARAERNRPIVSAGFTPYSPPKKRTVGEIIAEEADLFISAVGLKDLTNPNKLQDRLDFAFNALGLIALVMVAFDLYAFVCMGQMDSAYQSRYDYVTKSAIIIWHIPCPDLSAATFFDVIGYVLNIIAGLLWDVLIFVWFVFTQPFIYNIPAWFMLTIFGAIAYGYLKEQSRPQSGPLDILERQKAFGDAAPASREAIHAAMSGQSVPNAPRFKD